MYVDMANAKNFVLRKAQRVNAIRRIPDKIRRCMRSNEQEYTQIMKVFHTT
jgi:hypothetical protein